MGSPATNLPSDDEFIRALGSSATSAGMPSDDEFIRALSADPITSRASRPEDLPTQEEFDASHQAAVADAQQKLNPAPAPSFWDRAVDSFRNAGKQAVAGYFGSAAEGAHVLGNLADLAGKVTGTKPGGAFRDAEKYYEGKAAEYGGGKNDLASELYRGIGATPGQLAEYTAAAEPLGPIAGMAGVGAASAADKGPRAAAEEAAKQALMGAALHVIAPASLPARVGGGAVTFGGQAAAEGGNPTQVASSAITGAAMGAMGGRPEESEGAAVSGKPGRAESARAGAEPLSDADFVNALKPESTPSDQQFKDALAQNPNRRVTGSIDIPLNDAGREQAQQLAQRTAGQFDRIEHSPMDRAAETAQIVGAANPQAQVTPAEGLSPWDLGAHEGQPSETEQAAINDRVRNAPDEAPPGRGEQSTDDGEPFNDFRDRTIGHLQDQILGLKPGEKVLNITHGRDLRLIDSWLKNGAPEDKSVDVDHMTGEGDWPASGNLFRVEQHGLVPAEDASQPGVYYARHGETDFSGNGNEQTASAGQPLSAMLATVPERPETIRAQVEQLSSGLRRVVMLPSGTDYAGAIPQGMRSLDVPNAGRFIYDPEEIAPGEIRSAVRANQLPDILGAKDGGLGAPDKSQLQGPVSVVVAKDANGRAVQATATDGRNLARTLDQARKLAVNGSVHVTTPEAEIADRLAARSGVSTRGGPVPRAETLKPDVARGLAEGARRVNPDGSVQVLRRVPLDQIQPDEGNQIDPDIVHSYQTSGYAVQSELRANPEGGFIVTEGHNRITADARNGKTDILAWTPEQRAPSTQPAYGRETSIAVPGEKTSYPARYAVRELADVQPSHNAANFQPNPAYEYTNDRALYTAGKCDARHPERGGRDLQAGLLTTDAPTAEHGTPVIDANGNALGGNSRTMTLSRVYGRGGAAAYRDQLAQKAQQFGIDPDELARFKNPVLVRELGGGIDAQKVITDFNKTAAAELTPEERAVSDGRRLSDKTIAAISGRLDELGEDGNARERAARG